MDDTSWLKNALNEYHPVMEGLSAYERVYKHLMLNLLSNNPHCFWRDDFAPGHITASMWVINKDASKILLLKHKKIGLWFQFGGHCDGNGNVLQMALQELEEESGITADMIDLNPKIFDLDIHCVPARGDEPEHIHYDVRFCCRYDDHQPIPGSAENQEFKWFSHDEAEAVFPHAQGRWRMLQKTKLMQA